MNVDLAFLVAEPPLPAKKPRWAVLATQVARISVVDPRHSVVDLDALMGLPPLEGPLTGLLVGSDGLLLHTRCNLVIQHSGLLPLRLPPALRHRCASWLVGVLCEIDAAAQSTNRALAMWLDLNALCAAWREARSSNPHTAARPHRRDP